MAHTDNGSETASIAYSKILPPGAKVDYTRGAYELDVSNVPGLPKEEFAPPMDAFAYRVRFYYTSKRTPQEYWDQYGKSWSKRVDAFAEPKGLVASTAQELTAGAKTDEEKLQRLYDMVMKLENTDFTREHSDKENKVEGVKHVKSASDVLRLKRGSSEDLALTFLALVRAAGFKAEAMQITNRDRDFFQTGYLDSSQLDDTLVAVTVGGKERVFDPGERYVTFGQLHWKHALASGIREQDGKVKIIQSPGIGYQEDAVQRIADITVAPDGTISGSASIICTGNDALRWRQTALSGDEVALRKAVDDELARDLPAGMIIHTDHFLGLDSESSKLMIRMNASGSLGTATGKRMFLPVSVFAAGSHNPFTSAHRQEPVDLHYPYLEKDQITIHLPHGLQPETLPAKAEVVLPKMAVYAADVAVSGDTVTYTRQLVIANVFFAPAEYNDLKKFFDDVNNKDRAQLVLHQSALAAGAQ